MFEQVRYNYAFPVKYAIDSPVCRLWMQGMRLALLVVSQVGRRYPN